MVPWSLPFWPVGAASWNGAEQRCGRGAGEKGDFGWFFSFFSPGLWWVHIKSRVIFMAIHFAGLDSFEPNPGGCFMMVGLRFSAEEMLHLLRTRKMISGCLGGGHISGWWQLSWVPSSKFSSAFIYKSFSQSRRVFQPARFDCRRVSFVWAPLFAHLSLLAILCLWRFP